MLRMGIHDRVDGRSARRLQCIRYEWDYPAARSMSHARPLHETAAQAARSNRDATCSIACVRRPASRASFDLVPVFDQAQGLDEPWANALLGSAQIVAESADQLNVVVAYEGAGWRGTKISTFPEYQSVAEGRQLLYNALLWSSYPPVP